MTDYSKMSDFEINKLVAIHRGHQCYYGDGSFTNDGLNVTVKGNGRIGWFNPCRLPEDAWPILKEYCIDINWDGDSDSKPLRDAMIVYLMMKESDSAQG